MAKRITSYKREHSHAVLQAYILAGIVCVSAVNKAAASSPSNNRAKENVWNLQIAGRQSFLASHATVVAHNTSYETPFVQPIAPDERAYVSLAYELLKQLKIKEQSPAHPIFEGEPFPRPQFLTAYLRDRMQQLDLTLADYRHRLTNGKKTELTLAANTIGSPTAMTGPRGLSTPFSKDQASLLFQRAIDPVLRARSNKPTSTPLTFRLIGLGLIEFEFLEIVKQLDRALTMMGPESSFKKESDAAKKALAESLNIRMELYDASARILESAAKRRDRLVRQYPWLHGRVSIQWVDATNPDLSIFQSWQHETTAMLVARNLFRFAILKYGSHMLDAFEDSAAESAVFATDANAAVDIKNRWNMIGENSGDMLGESLILFALPR